MSSCDNSNIKQNYIVTNTNEFETLTACTGIWTSNIYGCSPITIRDQLKLNSVSNNNTLNRILVINNLTGLVQYRNINSIISGASGISDFTYNNENTFTITDTSGNILSSTIDIMSGLTINGVLSATTYQGLPLDVYVTGGTYSNGVVTFINNSGGTFNIGGLYTGQTNYVNSLTTGVGLSANTTTGNISIINTDPDQIVVLNDGTNISVTGTYPNFTIDVTGLTDNNTYTTGFTYQDNTFTISDTSGNTLSTTIDVMTGLTINGNLSATTISGGTLNISQTPNNETSVLLNLLSRDGGNGEVKIKTIPNTINYGLFSQTGDSQTVSGTDTETSIVGGGVGSLTVPSNGFNVGDSFHAVLIGHLSCINTATLHIRIKTVGGVLLADTGVMAMDTTTNKHWKLDINFTVRTLGGPTVGSISSGGLFAYTKNSGLNFEGVNFSIVNNTTFDTTVSNSLVITAQWNTNNAVNKIYSEILTLKRTY